MRDLPSQPDETFTPAPAGVRVRVITAIVVVVFIVIMAAQVWFVPHSGGADYWIAIFAPLVGVPIVVAVWWFARVRELRLEGRELIVVRRGFPVRFSLDGLECCEADRDPLSGARKIRGNDGLGAISGKFRSKKLGDFRAHVSDCEHGVVLRAAAGTMVVSPAQPSIFIDAIRRRTERISRSAAGTSDS